MPLDTDPRCIESGLVRNRGGNCTDLLIVADHGEEVTTRARALRRRFQDEPVKMQRDVRRGLAKDLDELKAAHSKVCVLHVDCSLPRE